jgi:hypothetical protein
MPTVQENIANIRAEIEVRELAVKAAQMRLAAATDAGERAAATTELQIREDYARNLHTSLVQLDNRRNDLLEQLRIAREQRAQLLAQNVELEQRLAERFGVRHSNPPGAFAELFEENPRGAVALRVFTQLGPWITAREAELAQVEMLLASLVP